MGAATGVETARDGTHVPWGDVLLTAVASVSWALIGMAGTAALGLRLLEADAAGSLGPMTAAVVALGAGGSVTPSGDVSVFGLSGAEADTAIEITPLGVSLVGAVLLSYFFLRSLRAAGVVISPAELLARAGAVVALFVVMLGGLAWAGHDVITIDGGSLGLDDLTGGGGLEVPGLGDIGGLLPDRLGDLVDAQAAVGYTVDTAPTLLGGLLWSAGILLVALLASRRTPLPRGWEAVHRVVRPAVSAVVTVLLVAVAAGLSAAGYAAIVDDHPRRIAGAALLGAPNGVWLGVPVGLFVPWDGRATGELTRFLPDPLDDLLAVGSGQPVTLGRLAELDGRVWLLAVAAALMMLLAGVLVGVRTPVGSAAGAAGFAGRCALRLGVTTAVALPSLAWLTDVSVTASLSVLGFDAFGAGAELHGHRGAALLLGAVWGAGAGAAGALLAWACGAAGRSAAVFAREGGGTGSGGTGRQASGAGGERRVGQAEQGALGAGRGGYDPGTGSPGDRDGWGSPRAPHEEGAGPYAPGTPYRPPNPATNPYLRVPDELRGPEDAGPAEGRWRGAAPDAPREPEDARPAGERQPGDAQHRPGQTNRLPDDTVRRPGEAGPPDGTRPGGEPSGPGDGDVYGAPTVARPVGPPPRGPRQPPGPRGGSRPPAGRDDGPPPPPPPPPPPRKPRGGR
ncbi:streptophobe family protein [Streptomyces sp. NPDC006372]|uniref:streptophobe family protein n=1 Tax=Streptomyces sp. NPDC006372 TaxID=3155599 RepID=UPI0033B3C0DA